jgi:hypothetical protein
MRASVENNSSLEDLHTFAKVVDESIYEAVCDAIIKHLPVWEPPKQSSEQNDNKQKSLFPFDILLLGGDDCMLVTSASKSMDVALTIARRFHEITIEKAAKYDHHKKDGYTLSVGVVLAPIKYPFSLLQDMAESTLKYAKDAGANAKFELKSNQSSYPKTLINFMTVTGSNSPKFKTITDLLTKRDVVKPDDKKTVEMAATLRPYTVEELELLLGAIAEGHRTKLGRTKLYQIREAVMKLNLTTSVSDARGVLRNWQARQKETIIKHIQDFGNMYQERIDREHQEKNPGSKQPPGFPEVVFPWFADGPGHYRTSLVDFVELYDLVAQEGEGNENNAD